VLTCRPAASYESASQPTRQLLLVQQPHRAIERQVWEVRDRGDMTIQLPVR
jgi:hypothetical protein